MAIDTLPYPRDLTDGVVTLRPHRLSDADALAEAVRESVATVGRWQDWCHASYSADDARQWIDICRRGWLMGDGHELLIFAADGGTLLGGMGVNQIHKEHRFGNLGYWVRESAQGQGVATRAARLAVAFAFSAASLSRLEIVAAHDNTPSRKTAKRIGATFEGMLRNRLILRGTPTDAAMYSIIPGDMQP